MAGNTVHVQGNYVDVHDNEVVNLSIDRVGMLQVGENGQQTTNVAKGLTESVAVGEDTMGDRIRKAVAVMKDEGLLKPVYHYAWVMKVMNDSKDLPGFFSAESFLDYLRGLGCEDLPDQSSIRKKLNNCSGTFPNWTFSDVDKTKADVRINVAKRFISAYEKGI